jgi:hypothetical protein
MTDIDAPNTVEAVEQAKQHAATRAERLQRIFDGYEIFEDGLPDSTVPGAAKVVTSHGDQIVRHHPRYVLIDQRGDKGNYYANLAEDLRGIEQLAAEGIRDPYGSASPVCYFDLDQLAGPEPRPSEDDKVRLTKEGQTYTGPADGVFYVVGSETDTFDGEAYEKLYLSTNPDADYLGGDYDHLVDEAHVEIVESAEEDERLPVRYLLAKVVTTVVFNSTPEQP